MHLQDLFGIMLLIGLMTIMTSLLVLKHAAWARDGLQVGGLIFVIAFIAFGFAPVKPKSPEQIARDAKWAEEKTASELKSALEDQRQKDMVNAMVACGYAIKSRLNYPGSYSNTFFSSYNRQFETSNGWEIFKAFEAKNGFGGSLPQIGHCSITRGGGISVEIGNG
jgi:hypothetical protein